MIPKNLATRHSNAHAYRLCFVKDPPHPEPLAPALFALFAAISEALNYRTDFEDLSNFFQPACFAQFSALQHLIAYCVAFS